ncbi:hypothetical protein A2U01_0040995, partial [Trifolium medium]|nr:hypothetical protein [Trifolium medium]
SASGNGASGALQSLSVDVGIPHLGFSAWLYFDSGMEASILSMGNAVI